MALPSNVSSAPTASANHELLKAAWQRQQSYSKNASRHQQRFLFLRTVLAILGILVVLLAVVETYNFAQSWNTLIDRILLILPIAITALVAFSARFDRGQNWVLLRGSAESLKTEIYYYRTQVKPYNGDNRGVVLSARIQQISASLKGSPVHHGALAPYENEVLPFQEHHLSQPTGEISVQENTRSAQPRMGVVLRLANGILKGLSILINRCWRFLFEFEVQSSPQDNKYSDLTQPTQYLQYRLETQFEWYRTQAKRLAQRLQFFQASIYVFGAVGTLLAAFEPTRSWVAVTTALVAGCTNYLEVKRIEASLVGYNQAADNLYDIRAWWYSLSEKERKNPNKFKRLVDGCEGIIRSETTSWLQDMQDRLAQLYGVSDEDMETEENSDVTEEFSKDHAVTA
ncbi:DUF4231 domain-containing protein [Leptolyngbya cf. ectocarpi LEGE 11479]|uniref:DUF4231 domain-containing protein n=1 Tax=Leptolyngbya cf. ectocarpi LEGE 11479 TaxID=1828722 RepID=A0A928ZTJ2_LEPEC|nr:DUF4231 domain-containing protein [Leptolyngbya ectocarpi]MBE9065759.1 DUF4231 domain-containing protein [Leptolyngbya cf. ectocarpi LEGE 11479]